MLLKSPSKDRIKKKEQSECKKQMKKVQIEKSKKKRGEKINNQSN